MPSSPAAVPRFHVLGSAEQSPASERTVYVDGSAGSAFRPGVDLELSHWVPTSTPARWAADTSTEICLRFLDDPPPDAAGYDLAVNNHVDVDGILSVFCLVRPDVAVAHRDVVVGAAEMADLSAGVGRDAFVLAQELTSFMGGFRAPGRDPLDTYRAAFAVIPSILDGSHPPTPSVVDGWERLERQAAALAAGDGMVATPITPRLVGYALTPPPDAVGAARAVSPFNAVIDGSSWLWPHVRNRDHGQAAHVVSVAGPGGWSHDLWLPGYVWAHTPDRWRPPVLEGTGDSNTWRIDPEPLGPAVDGLRAAERNPGSWVVADQIDAFAAVPGRAFPVIVAFLDDAGDPAPSSLDPEQVGAALAAVFPGD